MAGNWYFARDKHRLGPFSWSQLRQLAAFGLLPPNDHIWEEGTPKWREAGSVAGLFPDSGGAREYYLATGKRSHGPYSANQVRAMLLSGGVTPETHARAADATRWAPLGQMAEFVSAVPATSASQAVLVMDSDQQMSREEAELYLAGKEGDTLARLIARLMDLKRKYAENTTLTCSLDRNINDLTALREQSLARAAAPPAKQPG
jgi:GYF domain 2